MGRQIVVHENGVSHTVVGVMPQGLDYPKGTDFWAALVPAKTRAGTDAASAAVDVIARLRTTFTTTIARDELNAFYKRPESPPWERNLHGVVNSLPRLILGDANPAVIAFTVAAGLLLLITCFNVANLLLVRGFARMREIAVRSALGAGRGQVVFQLLTENAVLAIAGGALGVAVAITAVRSFVAVAPPGMHAWMRSG